ncbi:MAG: FAD-binding oxidoreductase [Myxococcales bacterium]|nr:FAD-binding oxidoreductase [Myxococcales bacterium]
MRRLAAPRPAPSSPRPPGGFPWAVTGPAGLETRSRWRGLLPAGVGGMLVSPCDEQPWAAGVPPTELDTGALGLRLGAIAPSLARGAVRRAWACLRTQTLDREPVIGEDPRCPGLFWLGALGGRGMTCGLAAGEVAADCVLGRVHDFARLAPSRCLRDGDADEAG